MILLHKSNIFEIFSLSLQMEGEIVAHPNMKSLLL